MSRIGVSAVREILKVTEKPEVISFAGGLPAPELFPVDIIAKAHAEVFAESGNAALQYSTTEGWLPLRQWIAARMNSQGIQADAERVLITSGSQQGIDLVAKIFLEKGDKVIVENPSYIAALQAFNAYEADFVALESDDEGMCLEHLESAIQTENPKLIYVVADFHNPKGTTMALERRQQLVEIARRYRVPILEDNPYGELRYRGERLPPLASFDQDGLVIHVSTFSKTLSPGLRIGWVVAATEVIQELVVCKQAADLHTGTIVQRAAAKALELFDYAGHIEVLCKVYGERCEAMKQAIEKYFPATTRWTKPEGGLFLWVELPENINGTKLLDEALRERVAFVPGAPFFARDAKENFIRLNFSNSTPERIEEGIKRLGKVIKDHLG
ncbi:MAG: PLP-dependent aminotransferase family protein [Acidobacteria bacterium]|nr:PLP-dependent aminotransferase family protein [Acidobacteriota bacterium]